MFVVGEVADIPGTVTVTVLILGTLAASTALAARRATERRENFILTVGCGGRVRAGWGLDG